VIDRRVLAYASKRFEKQAHGASAAMRSLSTQQMGLYPQPEKNSRSHEREF